MAVFRIVIWVPESRLFRSAESVATCAPTSGEFDKTTGLGKIRYRYM